VADHPPRDRSDDSDGALEGHQDRGTRLGDEQTLADCDQTPTDSDQSSSASDHAGADRAQIAVDRDQSAAARLTTADQRDAGAHARDLAALVRDQAAAARDLAVSQRDQIYEHEGARALAAEDRKQALCDREQAARERLQALADRQALARQLTIAETDGLTGVRTRASGLIDLDHELDRCRRSGGGLVVAYVDVVGLKALNDSKGHAAGDELLKRVVREIRTHLRSYDLVMRIGGDEFLCAMSDVALSDARQRFRVVAGNLASSGHVGGIRAGLAALGPDEDATDLIERADAELIASRG
jgi:diguanylate cyclase (GGDEF)-like protein